MGNTCCGISGVTTGVVNPNIVADLEKKIDHELVTTQQKTIAPSIQKGEIIDKKIPSTPIAGSQEKTESNFKRDTNDSVAINSNSLINYMNNADKPDNVESKPVLDKRPSKELANSLNGVTPSPNKDATYTNEAAPNFEIKKKDDREKERPPSSLQKKRRLSKSRHDPTTVKSKPINLEEIKISEETAKKLKKISEGETDQKPSVAKTPIKRSKTINTNNEMSENDLLEPTESKYKRPDEFKKNALEDKKNMEKREVNPILKMKSLKNVEDDGKNEKTEKIEEPTLSPKKGLLKRCKTIGDKKKVKFKDVDLKKKKKGR